MRVPLSLLKVIAFATVVMTITSVTEGMSAYAQDTAEEKSAPALAKPVESSDVNPALALTTQHPDIPVEELALLVRPLTLAQLENEAAAWLLILQAKVQEISHTAIAVKRGSRAIPARQEAPQALEETRAVLEQAGQAKVTTTPGSEEYEAAMSKKELGGNEALQQALQEAIDTHIQALQESSEQIEEVAEDPESLKNQLVTVVIELQADRTAIADRFKVVLDELDKKGGNSATYRNYIEASDGIVIDFKDIEGLGILLINWIKSEEGGLRLFVTLSRTLGTVIGFFLFGLIADRLYNLIHHRVLPPFIEAQVLPILQTVSKITLWVVVIVLCLSNIGLEVSAILTGFGIGGLAIALAAQDTLSNILGGFTLLLQGKVTLGQRVEIAGIKAKIQEIGLRTTTLVNLDYDYQVVIPNSKFLQQVVNYIDSRPHYAIYETLHLHPTSTFEQILLAIDLIQKVAAENDYIKGVRPVFSDFNDYAFDIKLVFWIKKWRPEEKDVFPNDLWKISMVRSQMNLGILQQFETHDLKLALPIQLKELPQTFRHGVFSLSAGNCQNSIGKTEVSRVTKDGFLSTISNPAEKGQKS